MRDRLQPAEVEVTQGAASCPGQKLLSAASTDAATFEESESMDPW